MTQRLWLTAVGLGLLVTAVFWLDVLFLTIAFLGPLLWGAFAGAEKLPWKWPVTVSLIAGLGALAVHHEDVAFHLALLFTLIAIGWSGWSIGRRFPA